MLGRNGCLNVLGMGNHIEVSTDNPVIELPMLIV